MENPKSDAYVLRKKARVHVECGPVTESYHSDPESVVNLLNEALATELVCVLRYRRHYFMGEPDFNPSNLASRSLAEYVEGKDLADMIKENLVAERVACDSYRSVIQFLGNGDPTTRRLIEEILETHADDLAQLLDNRGTDESAYEKYKGNGGTSD